MRCSTGFSSPTTSLGTVACHPGQSDFIPLGWLAILNLVLFKTRLHNATTTNKSTTYSVTDNYPLLWEPERVRTASRIHGGHNIWFPQPAVVSLRNSKLCGLVPAC